MIHELLEIGPHVTALPIVHGRGDFAWEVRRLMLKHQFDCVAVPIPPSFQTSVEQAILNLPVPSLVFQHDLEDFSNQWQPPDDSDPSDQDEPDHPAESDRELGASFVPIDPCQGVILSLIHI